MQHKLLQIIDANLNRAREGLRVCEDIARFAIADKDIARLLKSIRHGATKALLEPNKKTLAKIVLARDTEKDILKFIDFKKHKRTNITDLFMFNIQRVKESLRVLEECSKILDEGVSVKFRKLRFSAYDVEQKAVKSLTKI
jgi:thiamine-phosphate pyrophosphorylase